jgi:hypothetical protein
MKVEKGVPLPTKRSGGHNSKYPWAEMEDGDSVLIERIGDEPFANTQRRVSNNSREWLKRNREGWTAITAREGNGIRVWFKAPEA